MHIQRRTKLTPDRRLLLLAAAAAASSVHAAPDNWTLPSSSFWSTASNWSNGVPIATSDVLVTTPGGGQNITVSYDTGVSNTNVLSLTIDTTATGSSITLGQGVKSLGVAGNEVVGNNGRGTFSENGGINNVTGTLVVGNAVNSSGTYSLSSGTLNNANGEEVGYNGIGVFNHTGGVNNAAFLAIGNFLQTGASGNYNLSGTAALNVSNNESVGDSGIGFFNQTGGVHTVNGNLGLLIGYQSSASGTYTLSAGTLTATNVAGISIGYNGRGVFNQSGGVNTSARMVLGSNAGSTGIYNQTGGVNSPNALTIGFAVGSSGSYNLSGTASFNALTLTVGSSGSGVFNQTGGSITTTYTDVGDYAGNCVFNQSGGVHNVSNLLAGYQGSGTYNLSNTATLNVSGDEYLGYISGNAAFNQTGGSHSITGTNGLYLGYSQAASGTYTLSGGSLNAGFIGYEYVGYNGTGVFNQSGGNNLAPGLTLGALSNGTNAAASGTYNLTAGSLSANFEAIGVAGTGLFTQTGGTNQATFLNLGVLSNGPTGTGFGTYALSGGVLSVGGTEAVGVAGVGVLNQSGGQNSANDLTIAQQAGSVGTFSLSNGATLRVALGEVVGNVGIGTFNHTGGSNFATTLIVANSIGSSGTYNFSGGALTTSDTEYIGYSGSGVFNQSGGTHRVSNALNIANPQGSGSPGAYNLSAGSLIVSTVQLNPGGTFNQTGGTLAAGTFNQVGGVVTGTLQNTGTFNYSNGLFSGRLLNQGVANLGTAFTAGNGIENDTSLTIAAGQTVTANGNGFDNENSLTVASGTLNGSSFLNNGFVSAYGTIGGTGGFTNNGYLSQGTGSLALTNLGPNVNNGNIALAVGRPFSITATLTNAGLVAINGGVVSGAATLSNSSLGTITGFGTIGNPLTQAGTLVAQGGALNVSKPFVNSNLVQIAGPGAALNGAGVTNNATLQGNGVVGLPVDNAGTVEAVGGTLSLNGAVTNEPLGLIRAATGTKVLVVSGLATNPGLISLVGGTFDNGGKPIVNTGQITGYGTFAAGSMTNAAGGSINVAGGPGTFNGPLVNAAGGTVHVNVAAAVFTGAVTNNGTFRVDNGSATFAAGFVNNGTYISDPSTNAFNDLTVGGNGALVGGAGDRFTLTGDLRSASARPDAWDTSAAALAFTVGASSTHALDVSGTDGAGNLGNFGWGALELAAGQSLVLHDPNAPGGALYTSILQLDGAPGDAGALATYIAAHVVNADAADPLNVYYDPTQAANAYLGDATYALGNGGVLAPSLAATPEPATLACAAVSLAGLLTRRRSPRRKPQPKITSDTDHA